VGFEGKEKEVNFVDWLLLSNFLGEYSMYVYKPLFFQDDGYSH
jgi:hypothetical protein